MKDGSSYDDAIQSTWARQPAKADADFDYLVHYATLAANSHNTQPWLFRKTDERVTIEPDLNRSTPVVDPDSHHLFASLGCAAENLMLAASAAGRGAALAFDATGDGSIEIDQVTTPEPASVLMLGTGLLGFGIVVRRGRTA